MKWAATGRGVIHVTMPIAFCLAALVVNGGEKPGADSIKLNEVALQQARALISKRKIVNDKKGFWKQHRISAAGETEFIHDYGWDEYARWHLGIDERYAEHTRARYKFPYGDFKTVHRCALLAAQNRAAQYQHQDIEQATKRLLEMIGTAESGE